MAKPKDELPKTLTVKELLAYLEAHEAKPTDPVYIRLPDGPPMVIASVSSFSTGVELNVEYGNPPLFVDKLWKTGS